MDSLFFGRIKCIWPSRLQKSEMDEEWSVGRWFCWRNDEKTMMLMNIHFTSAAGYNSQIEDSSLSVFILVSQIDGSPFAVFRLCVSECDHKRCDDRRRSFHFSLIIRQVAPLYYLPDTFIPSARRYFLFVDKHDQRRRMDCRGEMNK